MNLQESLKNIDGSPVKVENDTVFTFGKAFANYLMGAGQKCHDPLRAYILATKFYTEESFELNQSDRDFVKNLVKESGGAVLIVGQLLQALEK